MEKRRKCYNAYQGQRFYHSNILWKLEENKSNYLESFKFIKNKDHISCLCIGVKAYREGRSGLGKIKTVQTPRTLLCSVLCRQVNLKKEESTDPEIF